ncbi:MAG TPA: ATPase domain-containing protein [Gemmatimonadaceae bacterium]|nr:ATPase domain-containing protein [Gemmatimonadaceae bacterium]
MRTGNAEADAILGGGLPINSINIIMGAPGTGKTLLAQQLALHNATPDRPAVYFTTLSEPLAKVITYLQGMAFYDDRKMGSAVLYEDLGPALVSDGAAALVRCIAETIKHISPRIIVVDSFKAVHDLSTSTAEMRHVVADLAGLLSAYECTTFLVGEYEEDDIVRYPEFAAADGIIELARYKETTRDERYVRVSKLRGASYREGLHGFRITPDGLEFFPRLVSPDHPPPYQASLDRVSTGIVQLDTMLGGGLPRGTSTLIAGPTGSGKTTAAVQFCLEGVQEGEPALFLNFQENPTQLRRLVDALNVAHSGRAADWHAMYVSPVELQIDSLIGRAFKMIRDLGVRRFVVDGVGDLFFAARDPQRVHDYLYALGQHLAVNEITTIFTYETVLGMGHADPYGHALQFSALMDCILSLDIVASDRLRRTVCVRKLRNSAHDLRVRDLDITFRGLQIGGDRSP